MKRLFSYALVSALLAAPGFAANAKNAQSFHLPAPVSVGSTQLPAGDYKLTWTGTAPNVQLTLEQHGKAPVTVPAKLVEEKHERNAYTVNHIGGVDQLETIQLNKVSITLENTPAQGQ